MNRPAAPAPVRSAARRCCPRRLVAAFAARTRRTRPVPGIDELTAREREVGRLIAQGLSNAKIARKIYVSQSTVKTHVTRAIASSAHGTAPSLSCFACQAGLARPGWAS